MKEKTHIALGIVSRQNNEGKNEYLLASSKRNFGEFTGFYYPPGGHVEECEDEKSAVCRECLEEVGVEVEAIEKIAEIPGDLDGLTTHWWRCEVKGSGEISIGVDIQDADYFTREQMENMDIWPATKQIFQEFIFTDS